jgi:hypothetical protein
MTSQRSNEDGKDGGSPVIETLADAEQQAFEDITSHTSV